MSVGAITTMAGPWEQPPANGIFGVGLASGNCNGAALTSTSPSTTCKPEAMTTFLAAAGQPDRFAVCLGTANFGIILDHVSRGSQLHPTPHAPCAMLYLVPMLAVC